MTKQFTESTQVKLAQMPEVKLCGLESLNGRVYTQECLTSATPLYEGVPVYVNHDKSKPRLLEDRWGTVTKPHMKADGLYGTIEYLQSHPMTPVLEEAEAAGMNIGMSHVVMAQSREGSEGIEEVFQIDSVKSVDVVSEPATTKTFHEEEEPKEKDKEEPEEPKKEEEPEEHPMEKRMREAEERLSKLEECWANLGKKEGKRAYIRAGGPVVMEHANEKKSIKSYFEE